MRKVLYKVWRWCKGEAVLVVAALGAVVTAFFVSPSVAYLGYIDGKVLCLLFCLMAVVAGWRECGVFEVMAQRVLSGRKNVRVLQLLLVLLPFFMSMLITNDVALITFVPFTLLVLQMANEAERILPVVILQAVAANLGSMATPVGNPQNLFLCGKFNLTAGDFFATLLPFTVISFVVLCIAALWGKKGTVQVSFKEPARITSMRLFAVLVALFALCLLAVFRVVHYGPVTLIVVAVLAVMRPQLFRKVDVSLLATFVFFFIFAGNMGEIPALRDVLAGLMVKNALLTSAVSSQFISNVPSAVLLANFTDDWQGLLLGVDLGGLGTPIASLASLIALRYYFNCPGAQRGKFLLWFTVVNVAGLVGLVLLTPLFIG